MSGRREWWVAAGLLVLVTLAVYGQAVRLNFVNYDDPGYVTQNGHVRGGLTWGGLAWALTAREQANWHPLTWLSHMLDCQLYGPRPGQPDATAAARGHHLTSVAFHLGSVLLLFMVLVRMTRATWPSAVVAALFAVHPLHVESVAWISERKDVLSTFLEMAALLAYVRYTERPSVRRYLPVVGLFVLGLTAKPMLVTFPFLLLLLDYWPLGRLRLGWLAADARALPPAPKVSGMKQKMSSRASAASRGISPCENAATSRRLVLLEKLPLVVLAAASSLVTFIVQEQGGAVAREFSFAARLANAVVVYVEYLLKAFVPMNLVVFYPHAAELPAWEVVGAAAILVAVTAVCVAQIRRRPYLAGGWFWYLGTLVPVIGLIQVGMQAMADRYTYVPLIGIFILVVWGAADLFRAYRRRAWVLAPAAVAAVGTCAVLAAIQLSYWKDAKELLRHATAVDQDNVVARIQLGAALIDDHDYYGAVQCLEEAEKVGPPRAEVQASLGMALAGQGRMEEAVMHLQAALGLKRGAADARKDALNNLAWIRATCADPAYRSGAEAVRLAEEACKITDRRRPDMLDTLAAAYAEAGRYGDAVTTALEAEALATAQGLPGIARELLDRVRLYQAGKPYHERPPAGAPGISGPKQSLVIPNERSESRNLAVGAPSAPVSQQDPSASLGVTTKKDLPESREAPPASSARAAP